MKHGAMDYLVVKGRKTQREILSGKAVKLLRGAKASEVVDEAGSGSSGLKQKRIDLCCEARS